MTSTIAPWGVEDALLIIWMATEPQVVTDAVVRLITYRPIIQFDVKRETRAETSCNAALHDEGVFWFPKFRPSKMLQALTAYREASDVAWNRTLYSRPPPSPHEICTYRSKPCAAMNSELFDKLAVASCSNPRSWYEVVSFWSIVFLLRGGAAPAPRNLHLWHQTLRLPQNRIIYPVQFRCAR